MTNLRTQLEPLLWRPIETIPKAEDPIYVEVWDTVHENVVSNCYWDAESDQIISYAQRWSGRASHWRGQYSPGFQEDILRGLDNAE